jgi:hypothetical protein
MSNDQILFGISPLVVVTPGWACQHSDFETECVRLRFRRIGYQWIGTASRSKNCVGCFLGALLSPAPEWHDPLLAGR